MSFNLYISPVATITSIRKSSPDFFVSEERDRAETSMTSFDSDSDAIREVFELEFWYFSPFLFDKFCCFAEHESASAKKCQHTVTIINNNYELDHLPKYSSIFL